MDDDLVEESHGGVADNRGDPTGAVHVSGGHRSGHHPEPTDVGPVMGVRERFQCHADET